ncbi:MAG: M23 family metallopeptidase [Gemmatimonadales bacterium]
MTISVLRDGDLSSASYRVPVWAFRAAVAGAAFLGLLILLGIAFYAPIARQAAKVPGLERQLTQLQSDNAKIRSLAEALDSVEARYGQLRKMVGAEVVPDPVVLASNLPMAPAIEVLTPGRRRRFETGPSAPRHWPLDERGYLTRGQVPVGLPDEPHPGIDLAIPTGTPVRAAGGGSVAETGSDAEYGLFVVLNHPGGYQSKYGHLSRVVVTGGQRVRAGEVIGRSGNTGRSSAPHLHLEISFNGSAVDPLTLIRENR